jgi:hypothetical protein
MVAACRSKTVERGNMTDHSNDRFTIKWIDRGVEPKHKYDPKHPQGVDIEIFDRENNPVCIAELPWPARRCGYYMVGCKRCGYTIMFTTAGRIDDPRSVMLLCNPPPDNRVAPDKNAT